MKSEKGVTLTALAIYITVFILIILIMSFVSNYFFENVGQIKDSPKYVSEFNKFSFKQSEYTQNSFTKTTIIVKAELGNETNKMERQIEFVLKYW